MRLALIAELVRLTVVIAIRAWAPNSSLANSAVINQAFVIV